MNTKDNKEISFKWFIKTLKNYKFMYLELIFIAVCLRLIGLVEPFIFQVLIDRIIPFQREASLVLVVIIFIGVSIFQLLFLLISDFLRLVTSNSVTAELAARIYKHLFALPLAKYRNWSIGDVTARLNETDTIKSFLVGTTTGVFLDLVFVVVYLFILFSLSASLTLIIVLALPIQFVIYFAFGPLLRQRIQKSFVAGANHQTQLIENVQGILTIKTLTQEEQSNSKVNATLDNVIRTNYKVSMVQIATSNLIFVVDKAITVFIIYFGAFAVFNNDMTMGELIAFHLISNKVFGPIQAFSQLWESWQNIRISRQRLGDIVNSEPEPFERLPELTLSKVPQIHFKGVVFAYGPLQVLQGLSCSFAPHTLNLIVGRSGVGKSTFGKLAIAIERPDKGAIYFDENNISDFDPGSLRAHVLYVSQNPFLFAGSLWENLFPNPDYELNEFDKKVLSACHMEALLEQLPEGWNTQINEGGNNLSGGQRQRVVMARALLKRPKVLILDEPINEIDLKARQSIIANLHDFKKVFTLIVITHNAAEYEQVDQIINFDEIINYD